MNSTSGPLIKRNEWSANQDFVKAGQHLKKQADWLHFMGQEQLSFDVQEHALDIYLKANTIAQFLSEIMRIPEER